MTDYRAVVDDLIAMHKLAAAVAEAKSHDGIGCFGAEEDLCRAAFSLKLGDALINAAVAIEALSASPAPAGDLVERVAKAHWDSERATLIALGDRGFDPGPWPPLGDDTLEMRRSAARAVIAAMQSPEPAP